MPKFTLQRLAIAFLVLAGLDVFMGQRVLGTVFAALAIAISLGAGPLERARRSSGKDR
jgi:hypothetical protein